MSNQIRLSVIIPGFNTPERDWRRCINSVLKACSKSDEVICVDDGSACDTKWMDSLPDEDRRIRVVHLERNMGLPSARNAAIDLMKGKYATFVDSDDEVRSESFSKSIEAIEDTGGDIAIYGLRVIWENDGLCRDIRLGEKNYGALNGRDLYELHHGCLFDYACNKIYRKSFLDDNELRFEPSVRTGEDTVFNISCVLAEAKWCNVDYVGYIYYRRDGTMLSSFVPNARETFERKAGAWRMCMERFPEFEELSGGRFKSSERDILSLEWRNLWRRKSPAGLREKWHFLRLHREISNKPIAVEFVNMAVYSFLRGHFYLRPVRRWHIRRLNPDVVELSRHE